MMRNMIRGAAAVVLPLSITACYEYTPVRVGELAPGHDVRAVITEAQAEELGRLIGREERQITGTVLEADGSRIMLEVKTDAVHQGASTRYLTQRVSLSSESLLQLEERRLNTGRTVLLAGAITAAAGAIIAYNLSQGDNSPVGDGKDPPDAYRFPLIRLKLPIH